MLWSITYAVAGLELEDQIHHFGEQAQEEQAKVHMKCRKKHQATW